MLYSHVVSLHSTNSTITSLTSGIGRDPVLSSVYGRSCLACVQLIYKTVHRVRVKGRVQGAGACGWHEMKSCEMKSYGIVMA
jgi:hypothetical protein